MEELQGTIVYTSIVFTKIKKMYFSNKNCDIEKCTIKMYKATTLLNILIFRKNIGTKILYVIWYNVHYN